MWAYSAIKWSVIGIFFGSSGGTVEAVKRILRRNVCSRVVGILLNYSKEIESGRVVYLMPRYSFSVSLSFLSGLPSVTLSPGFS